MDIDLYTLLAISLGQNKHLGHAVTLPPIPAPRPYPCAMLQFTAKTLALMSFGQDNVKALIVEDDATPTKHYKPRFQVPDDADVVYLGWSAYRPVAIDGGILPRTGPVVESVEGWDDIVRVRMTLATHAILYLTRAGVDWSRRANIQSVMTGKPSDLCMAESLSEIVAYGMRRPMFFQGPLDDNRNCYATLICMEPDGMVACEP